MAKRHDAVGIKQVVRLEWYDYALDMLIEKHAPEEIRKQLDGYIGERLQSGGYGDRGKQTYTKAVTQIMKCWVTPDKDLAQFRDAALHYAQAHGRENRLALHWIVTVAAYPFWFRVASQVGRLLNLQHVTTQQQIRARCFETMGERSTIERSARRVIRSMVAWGVLQDSEARGGYTKSPRVIVDDLQLAALMYEAALHATPDGKQTLGLLLGTPALFPFQLPVMTGDFISRHNDRIEVVRYGLNDELISLNATFNRC